MKNTIKDFFREFRSRWADYNKNGSSTVFIGGIYVVLCVWSIMRGACFEAVAFIGIALLFFPIMSLHNMYYNKMRPIMQLLPLSEEDKRKYMKKYMLFKQWIVFSIQSIYGITAYFLGYQKWYMILWYVISSMVFSITIGIVYQSVENQGHFMGAMAITTVAFSVANAILSILGIMNLINIFGGLMFGIQIIFMGIMLGKYKKYEDMAIAKD